MRQCFFVKCRGSKMYFSPNKTIIFEFASYSYGKNLREAYSSKKQKSHLEHNTNYMMHCPMFWYATIENIPFLHYSLLGQIP